MWSALLATTLLLSPQPQGEPPSRALLLELTEQTRLAGTRGSQLAAERCAAHLAAAGFQVELDRREVVLALPTRTELRAVDGTRLLFERWSAFDPDAIPAGDVPLVNSGTKSGRVQGRVVDAGRGLRADFQRLAAAGVDVRGCIALVRYGGAYRGVKVDIAAEHGCVGVLLWNDPARDGFEKGAAWPLGPWKPAHEAERGSVTPIGRNPGDASTPDGASPAPGGSVPRLEGEALEATLSRLPCLPIAAGDARQLLARLAKVERDGAAPEALGPGPATVELAIEAPPRRRTLVNVVARLAGDGPLVAMAGNHRDAWVRGANDAASGTVALLRAAQHLGERARQGWRPRNSIVLALWDGEEFGLVGSTEWGEAHARELRSSLVAYVNMDVGVSGTRFQGADGTPGLLGGLQRVLQGVPAAGRERADAPQDLWQDWNAAAKGKPAIGFAGSGSDFAVFLHHLSLPVLDFGLGGGGGGGQYHTPFDDLPQVERHIDPGYTGHELAGRLVADLLQMLADSGDASFDAAEAARALSARASADAEAAAQLSSAPDSAAALLSAALAEAAGAFDAAAARLAAKPLPGRAFYAALEEPLPGRPWFKNQLWAPGLELGYGSESFPLLRAAAAESPQALRAALDRLVARIAQLGA